jgi:hypothetical protein
MPVNACRGKGRWEMAAATFGRRREQAWGQAHGQPGSPQTSASPPTRTVLLTLVGVLRGTRKGARLSSRPRRARQVLVAPPTK